MPDPNDYMTPQYQPTAYGETPQSPQSTPLIMQILANVGKAAAPVAEGFAQEGLHPLESIRRSIMGGPEASDRILAQGNARPDQMSLGSIQDSLGIASTAMTGGVTAPEGSLGVGGSRIDRARYYTQDRIALMHDLLRRQAFRDKMGGSDLANLTGSGKPFGPQGPDTVMPAGADVRGYGARKLSEEDAQHAITMYNQGVPSANLADYFNMNRTTMSKIISAGGYSKNPSLDTRGNASSTGRPINYASPTKDPRFQPIVEQQITQGKTYQEIAQMLSQPEEFGGLGKPISSAMIGNWVNRGKAAGTTNLPQTPKPNPVHAQSPYNNPDVRKAIADQITQGKTNVEMRQHIEQNVLGTPENPASINHNTFITWINRLQGQGVIPKPSRFGKRPQDINEGISNQLGPAKPFDPNET